MLYIGDCLIPAYTKWRNVRAGSPPGDLHLPFAEARGAERPLHRGLVDAVRGQPREGAPDTDAPDGVPNPRVRISAEGKMRIVLSSACYASRTKLESRRTFPIAVCVRLTSLSSAFQGST